MVKLDRAFDVHWIFTQQDGRGVENSAALWCRVTRSKSTIIAKGVQCPTPQLLLAFEGGERTAKAIARAEAAGLPIKKVERIRYDRTSANAQSVVEGKAGSVQHAAHDPA